MGTKAPRRGRPPSGAPLLSRWRLRALRLPRELRGDRQSTFLHLRQDLRLLRKPWHLLPALRTSHDLHPQELHLHRSTWRHHLRERCQRKHILRHQHAGRPHLHHRPRTPPNGEGGERQEPEASQEAAPQAILPRLRAACLHAPHDEPCRCTVSGKQIWGGSGKQGYHQG